MFKEKWVRFLGSSKILLPLVAILTFCIGVAIGTQLPQTENITPAKEKYTEIKSLIDDNYYFETSSEAQIDGVYRGLVASLGDEYSKYFTKDEYDAYKREFNLNLVGIGATVEQNISTGEVVIISVVPGAPADIAGLQAGDYIESIEGVSANSITLDVLVSKYVIGEEGTKVSLNIYRPSTDTYTEYSIERKAVQFPSVNYQPLDDQTGYIQITEFSSHTAEEFKNAINIMETNKMNRLVIDLRDNYGGSLSSVLAVADYLMPDKLENSEDNNTATPIAFTLDKKDSRQLYFCADKHSVDMSIAVLVNGESASASELLTGALQDNGRAVIIGTQTYGKGIVQSPFDLKDGSGLQLTISQYYTPRSFALHGVGLTPDIIMEQSEDITVEDKELETALLALDEIEKGNRKLTVSTNVKNNITPPKTFTEKAKETTCKLPHFEATSKAFEECIPKFFDNYSESFGIRNDNWIISDDNNYEWLILLSNLESYDVTVSADPISEKLHSVEIHMPKENAIDCTMDLLSNLVPSLKEENREKIHTTLLNTEISKDGFYTNIYKEKGINILASLLEDEILTVLIEP